MRVLIVLLALLAASQASAFSYATGDCATAGCASGEQFLHTNANEIDTALDALEARDTIAEHESVDGVNVILSTEIDTSAEVRAILTDETGTGAAVFAGGAIGAATATTASSGDNDTSVATTAFVQTELATKSAATSTDNAVARFDSTAGDVQNSGVTIDDSNNLTVPGDVTGGTSGAFCLILRDSDDAGNSACEVLNGTFSCEVDTNNTCGDAT